MLRAFSAPRLSDDRTKASRNVQDTQIAAGELARMAGNLQDIVSRFKYLNEGEIVEDRAANSEPELDAKLSYLRPRLAA